MKNFLFIFIVLFLLTSCFFSTPSDKGAIVENSGITDNTNVINNNSNIILDDKIDVKIKLEEY
jgi:hypothetical protein